MKTMTLFVDGSANDRVSLATAVAFCRCLEGRLFVVPTRLREIIIPELEAHAVIQVQDDRANAVRAAAAKAAFDEVCGALDFAEWCEGDETETEAIIKHGLLSDLVILERVSREDGPEVLALNTALFETPGPVLVTPPKAPSVIGRSVAVVWGPSIQSARALRSALPILKKADRVTTLTNAAQKSCDPAVAVTYLEDHGVKTEIKSFGGAGLTARARGRAILSAAASCEADLLVMGAYGENRLTALMGMGRATKKVVSSTEIPALLQH
jgi:nucleotide-binding universal stress UspA family protein